MKISIIMPSYNQGRYVEASIISLIEQDYAHKELIFIDGGSTDETMKIFEKYKKYFTHHVSEKDLGQSDALQKGFNRASGDVDLTLLGGPPAKLELGGYGRPSGSTGTECRSGRMGEARPFLGLELDILMSCVA